jgi:DHA2 family multidrug resistance protein
MSATVLDKNDPSAEGAQLSPWLVAILVALASFMEVLDTTIANVALPYIAGGMGVSVDEASWVVTTYLVANAVSLTASSYLAQRLGRKRFFLICLALFTATSVLCGFAPNLETLLLLRLLQGLGGGGMVPVGQSILASAFSPEKRGQGFALFGIAVVVAPVVGPTLGGWLSDNVSWEWCFEINGPVGIATIALISTLLREPTTARDEHSTAQGIKAEQGIKFDLVGFVLVATFLGALELVLDRGQEYDWFSSSFITGATFVSATAFVIMIPWELSRPNPLIDLRMVANRQFGTGFLVMLATGAILLGTTQYLPQLVQQQFGYTATWAGFVLSPGGLVTALMMPVVGPLSAKIQPRYLIACGAVLCAVSMYDMTRINGDVGFWFLANSRIYLGIGLPLIFIPILAASYDGLPPQKMDLASALMNAARNTGGSIGISLCNNVLAHREQFHQNRLVELANASTLQYQETLKHVTDYFLSHGSSLGTSQQQAVVWIGQQIQAQSTLLAYIDVFWVMMLICLGAVPLSLTLRRVVLGIQGPAGH